MVLVKAQLDHSMMNILERVGASDISRVKMGIRGRDYLLGSTMMWRWDRTGRRYRSMNGG